MQASHISEELEHNFGSNDAYKTANKHALLE